MKIELGISTFGDTTPLEKTGKSISHDERIRNMIEEIELADKVGLDIYAVGEHHRADFAVSSPEMILAAGAVNTKNIILSSAVTVLSSNDPVRVYQNFAHVDALSNGRAEIMVGRGSFTESFPLFGYDLKDYNTLFDEKLDMLLHIKNNEIVDWKPTKHTQRIDKKGVYPRAVNLPIWAATGGNPNSAIKIAKKGLPIAFAIISGDPIYFRSTIDKYKEEGKKAGFSEEQLKVASHSWGYIAEDKEQAIKDFFYPTKTFVDNIARTRPGWIKLRRETYNYMVGDTGSMFVGDPEYVAKKIIRTIEHLGLNRFMIHLPTGSIPHENTLNAIKLFGEKVAPIVRKYFEGK